MAKIKSIFEKGSKDGEILSAQTNTRAAGRTMATLGLSPGALSGTRRRLVQDRRHRKMKLATINSDDEADESFARDSTHSPHLEMQLSLRRRGTMSSTGDNSSPVKRIGNGDRSEKDWQNLKDNLGLSPGVLEERRHVFNRRRTMPHGFKGLGISRMGSSEEDALAEESVSGGRGPMNAMPPRRVSLGDFSERYNLIHTDSLRSTSRSPPRESRSQVFISQSQTRSTISKEMATLEALQNSAQVTSLIQQFSLQPTPIIRGRKFHPAKFMKREDTSQEMPLSAPIEFNSRVAGAGEAEEEEIEDETVVSEHTCETSSQFETETADYSYDEVTATEVEEIDDGNIDYLGESSIDDMDDSDGSYDLQSPQELNKLKVVLDFEGMEKPPLHVKEQHLKVIADIEILMHSTRKVQETERQHTIKERMLQDLLVASRKWGSDDIHQKLQNADLTVDEVSDIVAHINMCEQTNTPVRWDLIKDIVYPNGISEEAEEEPEEEPNEAIQEKDIQSSSGQRSKAASRLSLTSSMRVFSDKSQAQQQRDPLDNGQVAAEETFRNQYNLSENEMGDIVAHLTLCEETGTPIRWDLIQRIIYPDDDVSTQQSNTEVNTDPGSTMIDAFNDNESKASWFSIYPEFDDCASEITFTVETDETRKARLRSHLESGVESLRNSAALGGKSSVGNSMRSTSENSGLAARNDELLRKRVHALRASRHGSIVFDRKKKGLPILG